MDWDEVRGTLRQLREELLAERTSDGHWVGELSSSALSTATAVSALSITLRAHQAPGPPVESAEQRPPATLPAPPIERLEAARGPHASLAEGIDRGTRWLLTQANGDGGFGDTDRSRSNIATTMLVRAALQLARPFVAAELQVRLDGVRSDATAYWRESGGIEALRARYGKDKTFVIPILTNAALAGLVPWSEVQPLPFELAAVPQRLYRAMRMPVVSYAIPALVAIGQAHYYHVPPRNPLVRAVRRAAVERTMRVLRRMQPQSGGYLEATPLTAFVLMSLAATGREDHPVADAAVRFLQESMRPEGSWPIDTNLATWVTSLSVHALSVADAALAATSPRATPGEEAVATGKPQDQNWASPALLSWLLDCQHRHRHPFTGADPGGWGWSDLSGAVPDGDDTPAAIIALAHCRVSGKVPRALLSRVEEAQVMGMRWLLRLQNRDGGWPTFCRGWGKLPFDRSSTDLTAHALRALAWGDGSCGSAAGSTAVRRRAVRRGWEFLRRRQRADGALLPLWFGNQDEPDDENPVYGSARVLVSAPLMERSEPQNRLEQWRLLRGAAEYLLNSQRNDGGWGGGASRSSWCAAGTIADTGPGGESVGSGVLAPTSSVEETAQALEGLAEWYAAASRCVGRNANAPGGRLSGSWQEIRRNWLASGEPACRAAIIRGLGFVCEAVRQAKHHDPWPIGFYFAKLWYHEKLYPIVFATAAIGAALRALSQTPASSDEPL